MRKAASTKGDVSSWDMGETARAMLTVDALDAFEDDEHVELIDGELVRETTRDRKSVV